MAEEPFVLPEEAPDATFRDKLRARGYLDMPKIRLLLIAIDTVWIYILARLFGWLAYDKAFLRGRHFKRPWSSGWRWVYLGMFRKLFTGVGRGIPWPIGPSCGCGKGVLFDVDDLNVFQGTTNFQTLGDATITLGKGTWIAQGCALITTNHNLLNPDLHNKPESIRIGEHSWLGTNACVMPGVVLGPHTVVGANAVVTKSFPHGYCVLAGVPAKVIKRLEIDDQLYS